jgi:hypothetical protein
MFKTTCLTILTITLFVVTGDVVAADQGTSSQFVNGERVHLYDLVTSYVRVDASDVQKVCSLPGAEITIIAIGQPEKDGTPNAGLIPITVAVRNKGNVPPPTIVYPNCDPTAYVTPGYLYQVYSDNLASVRYTTQTIVTGILAVPFKFHLGDHSTTVGETLGAYIGYQTTFQNLFTVTPVFSAGLAFVSTAPAQASTATTSGTSPSTPATQTTATQTSTGFSAAFGFIGSATNKGTTGVQYGLIFGVDWLGKSAKYQYEGKPWLALEVGYNFAVSGK